MNLQQIVEKYKKLWEDAVPGTFERGAYYNIYSSVNTQDNKRSAAETLRGVMRNVAAEYRGLYKVALAELESPDKATRRLRKEG